MRIVNGILFVLLILFISVQYNDPDGMLWGLIYAAGVVWCGIAAFRSGLFAKRSVFGLYVLTMLTAIGGMIYYWPDTPRWWMEEVWWQTETAREGMGMMILCTALAFAGIVALNTRRV
jgi:hypothetical protein